MANFQSGLSGAGTGAIYGAQLTGGPWGGVAGGVIGGLAGLFGGTKDNKRPKPLDALDPIQRGLYQNQAQALQGGGGPLADIYGQYNPETMRDFYEKSISNPAYQNYQRNIVPTITGQFRGQNLQNSSYLGGALAQAGTDVQNNLNGQMSQLVYQGQQSSLDRRSNALDRILNLQSNIYPKQQASIFDNLLNSLSKGAGNELERYLERRRSAAPDSTNQAANTASSYQDTTYVGG